MDVETEKMCRIVKIGLFLFSQLNKCQTIQAFCQENVSHDKISVRAKKRERTTAIVGADQASFVSIQI